MQVTYNLRSLPEALHDDVRANTLLDVSTDLLEQLARKEDNTRGSIADLSVLSARDVHKCPSRGVHDLEELKYRRTIVGYLRLATLGHNQLVHAAGAQGARKRLRDRQTC